MANDRTLFATLLEQKSGDGGLHQAVLVPLGMLGDEQAHRPVEIFWELVFHTHVNGHGIGCLLQHALSLSTSPSGHRARSAVKRAAEARDAIENACCYWVLSGCMCSGTQCLGLPASCVKWKEAFPRFWLRRRWSRLIELFKAVEMVWNAAREMVKTALFTAADQCGAGASGVAIDACCCRGPSRSER